MDTTWKREALCRGIDPNLFFPEGGAGPQEARKVCFRCPVVDECREYGLMEGFGIWGGTTERDRRKIRKQRGGKHRLYSTVGRG